jgi:O-succinylbenzoic acid--CoA ligase
MRSLHAVLVERTSPRLLELLAAALDGSGPAILPLDAGLPQARLAELIDRVRPGHGGGADGVTTARSGQEEGVAEARPSSSAPRGPPARPRGSSSARPRCCTRRGPRWPGSDARPGQRWLCCLPATHIAGIQVLVRSLVSGTEPVLADRADAETVAAPAARTSRWFRSSSGGCWRSKPESDISTPLAGFASVLLGGAAAPQSLLDEARAAGVPVVTTYGMTETCGGCVYDGWPLDGGAGPDRRRWEGHLDRPWPVELFSGPGGQGPDLDPRAGAVLPVPGGRGRN